MVTKLSPLEELVDVFDEIDKDRERNKLKDYVPYGLLPEHPSDWQLRFHNTRKHTRMLSTGNQQGKTWCGVHEDAYHLTGRYPDWWKGERFEYPVLGWVCGNTSQKVRDSLQKYLFGDPHDTEAFGTGIIPEDCLDKNKIVSKYQVAGAYESVKVKHKSGGWSTCRLLAYEQKKKAFFAEGVDFIHLDEECDIGIYSSCVVRGAAKKKAIIYITTTPEAGLTELMMQFRNNLQPHQAYITATWADTPHLTPERQAIILSNIPAHEREMRSKGIPIIGTGVVYPIPDEAITCDMFKLPDYFEFGCGMDFGSWNHPTAMCWIAYDKDNDIDYIYDVYKEDKREPATHAMALKAGKKRYIPVFWPHDAHKADRKTSIAFAQEYRELYECNMYWTHSTNTPADGQKEGEGGISVNAGLVMIYNRMMEGKLKVFKHLSKWFNEKATYHTKDGKVVPFNNDIMDAMRYLMMMRRFMEPMRVKHKEVIYSEMAYEPGMV